MGEKDKSINLGEGDLYINDEHFAHTSGASLIAFTEKPEEAPATVRTSSSMEFSLNLEPVSAAFHHFAEQCRAIAEAWRKFCNGCTDAVLDECPNRRVAHLARHGKTARVRKKNWRRAVRLVVEKEGKA